MSMSIKRQIVGEGPGEHHPINSPGRRAGDDVNKDAEIKFLTDFLEEFEIDAFCVRLTLRVVIDVEVGFVGTVCRIANLVIER